MGCVDHNVESSGQQRGHLADRTAATCRKAEGKQCQLDVEVAGNRVGEALGELGLPGANIAGEYHERRPARHLGHDWQNRPVLSRAPKVDYGGVEQCLRLADQPGLDVVDADQRVQPALGVGVWVVEHAAEQAVGSHHGRNTRRCTSIPPAV